MACMGSCFAIVLIDGRERVVEYERRIQNLENLLKERSELQPQVQSQPLQPLPLHDPSESISLSMWVDTLRTEVEQYPIQVSSDLDPSTYQGTYRMTGSASSMSGFNTSVSHEPSEEAVLPSVDNYEPSADFEEDAALLQDPLFQPPSGLEDLTVNDSVIVPSTMCAKSLPEPELGASLLAEFLVDFNTVYGLYRPNEIAEHIRICYEGYSDGTALAWASAYVVLGIAHRARAQSNIATPMDNELADYYLHRILPTVSGLLIAPPTLGLVQCLIGLAMLIRTSSHSQPSGVFISTALRIAQFLAYEQEDGDDLSTQVAKVDVEQQRRVFWCAFMLDTVESIFSNAPTTHRKEDIRAPFPDENPQDSLGSVAAAEGDWKVNLFALRIRLALLQSDAIEQVFSISARGGDREAAARDVLSRLQAWRDNEVFRHSPEQLMQLLYRSDLMHVLAVEASYFATVFRIHAFLSLGKNPLVNPFSADVLAILAGTKEHGAYKDAERLLTHLTLIPHGDIGVCWMIKRPVIAALTTVLAHHVHALDSTLNSDTMREYARILNTLRILAEKSQDLELLRARDVCMAMYSRVETGLRVRWLEEHVDAVGIGSNRHSQTLA
ncbi:uncharacterized protein CC84DRAFT_1214860 [Paraphaeosphaeria sporulosa]|uniref:Xylanolytic transcriptional activator regulatory domain-containing protein n=1 Tax=Paraphaeosphaeria sporulosa TaxID=1460663 RepID=A0A177CM24_9PLEO|nr:uncharacterized protein CC84DRAFT_1214860 [Paraphaeosphaeria sporulosa]OAG08356.1 hypothetical protein CC84DRAFT_1214860 [Paraphaeosphaeria sporulosa]